MTILIAFIPAIAICQGEQQARFASTMTAEALQRDLSILAGPEMEGRETGTPGLEKAADFIESRMKAAGLTAPSSTNGYRQYYNLKKDSISISEVQINKKPARFGIDYISPVTQNNSSSLHANQVVFAGYGISDKNYDDYRGLNVKGKFVLIVLAEPRVDGKFLTTGTDRAGEWTLPGLNKKAALAKKLGAKGLMVLSFGQESFSGKLLESSKRTNAYFPKKSTDFALNHIVLAHDFARNLFGKEIVDSILATSKKNKPFVAADYFTKKMKVRIRFEKHETFIPVANMIGIVEGSSKKDEYVVLTAHYDHLGMRDGKIFYGADDDGSGTIAILHMGEAFMKAKVAGAGPARTIVILAVSGEEKGLWGSEYYSENPVFPLDKTSVNLNIDMIGRTDTERFLEDTLNYVYVVGHDKISTELAPINEAANKQFTQLTLDYKFDDPKDPNRIYFRSDHYNFARKGVPALFFYDGMLKSDYHKPTDTVDKINWDLYLKRTKLVFHTAWEMANREEMLKRDLPIPTMTR